MSDVIVELNERIRAWTTVLACSNWPAQEQSIAPHAVHTQSKLTRQFFVDNPPQNGELVNQLNVQLAAGDSLNEICQRMVQESSPELVAFVAESTVATDIWTDHAAVWQEAIDDLTKMFQDNPLVSFMESLIGRSIDRQLVIIPTLIYPMLQAVVAETATDLYVVVPPPKAWGESPPWPYHEGVEWVLGHTTRELVAFLMADQLASFSADQHSAVQHAAATLLFERALGDADGMAYLVQAKRQQKLPQLPIVVDALRDYIDDGDGRVLADVVSSMS